MEENNMAKTNTTKKDFPTTIVGLYSSKSGGRLQSAEIKSPYSAQLMTVLGSIKEGGRLLVRTTSPDAKSKNDKLPDAFLEYQTPEQVAQEKEYIASKKASSSALSSGDGGL
jgi:hypothetical protein